MQLYAVPRHRHLIGKAEFHLTSGRQNGFRSETRRKPAVCGTTLCKQSVGFAVYEVSPNYKSAIHVCMLAASVPGRHRSSKTARVFRSRQASAGQKLLRFAQKSRGLRPRLFPLRGNLLPSAYPATDISNFRHKRKRPALKAQVKHLPFNYLTASLKP